MRKPDPGGNATIDPGKNTIFLVSVHEAEALGEGDFANYV